MLFRAIKPANTRLILSLTFQTILAWEEEEWVEAEEAWDVAEVPVEARISLQEVGLCPKEMAKDRPVALLEEGAEWVATGRGQGQAGIVYAPVAEKRCLINRGFPALI